VSIDIEKCIDWNAQTARYVLLFSLSAFLHQTFWSSFDKSTTKKKEKKGRGNRIRRKKKARTRKGRNRRTEKKRTRTSHLHQGRKTKRAGERSDQKSGWLPLALRGFGRGRGVIGFGVLSSGCGRGRVALLAVVLRDQDPNIVVVLGSVLSLLSQLRHRVTVLLGVFFGQRFGLLRQLEFELIEFLLLLGGQ
jgi:hypothetical protein